jgi:aminoglycoside 3-N-acetyltransferase
MKLNILQKKITKIFLKMKIKKGDTLFIHSDLNAVFRKFNISLRDSMDITYSCLQKCIGPKGTIVVPAYYYEYGSNNKCFDLRKSPISKELGLFPKFIFSKSNSVRSLNPLTSVVALGYNAKKICNTKTCSGYGVDSPFDVLTKLDAKMIFLGVDLSFMTYVHYVEFMVGVPHRYNKFFLKPIIKNNKKINLPVTSQVRYNKVISDSVGNNKKFEKAKLVKKIVFLNNFLRVVKFRDAFKFLKNKLQKNFFYLLKNKPNFDKNKTPIV